MQGQRGLSTNSSEYNAQDFMISQMLGRIATAEPVRVVAVSGSGVSPVGFVDVQPLVNLVTGEQKAQEQSVLFKLPYLRIQGGKNRELYIKIHAVLHASMSSRAVYRSRQHQLPMFQPNLEIRSVANHTAPDWAGQFANCAGGRQVRGTLNNFGNIARKGAGYEEKLIRPYGWQSRGKVNLGP